MRWESANLAGFKRNREIMRQPIPDQTLCVIVDIDGTVADLTHRKHYLESKPKQHDKFYAEVHKDELIVPIAVVVRAIAARYPIIWVTGRRHETQDATKKWLRNNDLWYYPFELLTRKPDDYRADTLIKREILDEIKANGWVPFLAIDDRASVVSMWRENGITCMQTAPGDF